MHPATMQLMAEVRAQEMLLEARHSRSIRQEKQDAPAQPRRYIQQPTPTATAA
ncbi:MAG TPA: hypothetical protein VFH90_04720 [Candidatus Limnocylindria bacterium]|nr:hypothetical protein [Candidatus Limnocylindria bacterium]